ncbi:MAG: adenosine-specific kinase [Candidatus Omnitrophica bacterium]|nr:adenosine-specific kinase [Candidatus Omnitrophota bacterium]
MEMRTVSIEKPEDVNVILGQAHFIKTVEDLYEAIVSSAPGIKFGVAFCEASGACKVRIEGNDDELKDMAAKNALAISAGHCFIVMIREGFPINILNQIKNVSEVCSIFAASANPVDVVVVDNGQGRGILGVIDGLKPKGIENEEDIAWRKDLLRKIGYKR